MLKIEIVDTRNKHLQETGLSLTHAVDVGDHDQPRTVKLSRPGPDDRISLTVSEVGALFAAVAAATKMQSDDKLFEQALRPMRDLQP